MQYLFYLGILCNPILSIISFCDAMQTQQSYQFIIHYQPISMLHVCSCRCLVWRFIVMFDAVVFVKYPSFIDEKKHPSTLISKSESIERDITKITDLCSPVLLITGWLSCVEIVDESVCKRYRICFGLCHGQWQCSRELIQCQFGIQTYHSMQFFFFFRH